LLAGEISRSAIHDRDLAANVLAANGKGMF
jgi:hypothetical protein